MKELTNLYSLQKTLRFELKPVPVAGETPEQAHERLTRAPFFNADAERERSYEDAKTLIDDCLRDFIEEKLAGARLDWKPLADAIDAKDKKTLAAAESAARKAVVALFGNTKDLLSGKIFAAALPRRLEKYPESEQADKRAAYEKFEKFTTYFTGFWDNRKNVFSDKEQHTALAFRVVNENFPKFKANVLAFENAPEAVRAQLAENFPGVDLAAAFSVPAFNDALTQRGIDAHNALVGGKPAENGAEKIQGFNELVNLWRQQHPGEKPQKMQLLYKQILSDKKNEFAARLLQSDQDVVRLLKSLRERFFGVSDGETLSAAEKIAALLSALETYDENRIWLARKTATEISLALFGRWDALNAALKISDEDGNDGKKKEQIFSLGEIRAAVEDARASAEDENDGIERLAALGDFFKTVKKTADAENRGNARLFLPFEEFAAAARAKFDAAIADAEKAEKLLGNERRIGKIKDALDDALAIFRKARALKPSEKSLSGKSRDEAFYAELEDALFPIADCASAYDKIRNYLTKKPFSDDKMKLCFDCSTLANGWDENKIEANHALILRRGGKYFLGILNASASTKKRKEILDAEAESGVPADACFERLVYKYLADPVKMLPKVFFSEKGVAAHKPPPELVAKETRNLDTAKLIRFYQAEIPKYNKGDWNVYRFKFKKPEEYQTLNEFYDDVARQNYRIGFKRIPAEKIAAFVADGTLFLFEIYSKDFAAGATGKKNLHTIFWEAAFSPENAAAGFSVKLNGEAEIFWRKASLGKNEAPVHAPGSVLVNRRDADGNVIPEDVYQEIFKFKNGMPAAGALSDEARRLLASGKVKFKNAKIEIRKDRRYTVDKFLFHVPLTFNRVPREKNFTAKMLDEKVRELACAENSPMKIIGIDRGERNLISLVMINRRGEIEKQMSFNVIEEFSGGRSRATNYQAMLVAREAELAAARKSWKSIGKIAELKEGYISQVVHEIAKLVVENDALVVLENLNVGFKRGRIKVERQVYQKFEKALIEKLNFLVFKDRAPSEPGGVLNALQLTKKFESFEKLSQQSGILFYVPAGYTSKIDPLTGFANIFDLSGITNARAKRDFFSKFSSVRFDAGTQSFAFDFDYKNFRTFKQKFARTRWTVYSRGDRIVWNSKNRKSERISPTEKMREALAGLNVAFAPGEDIRKKISEADVEKQESKRHWDTLFRAFKCALQMRNSVAKSTEPQDDWIASPVKAADGSFFDSRDQRQNEALPHDADANGAYHIALKGLMGVRKNFASGWQKNETWFEFVQKTLRERS